MVLRPDLQDPVHLCRHDDERVADGRRSSGEARSGPARDDGEAVLLRDADAGGDLLHGRRERDEGRPSLEHRGVAGVQRERERVLRDVGGSEEAR